MYTNYFRSFYSHILLPSCVTSFFIDDAVSMMNFLYLCSFGNFGFPLVLPCLLFLRNMHVLHDFIISFYACFFLTKPTLTKLFCLYISGSLNKYKILFFSFSSSRSVVLPCPIIFIQLSMI
jgi:hypothetical protein